MTEKQKMFCDEYLANSRERGGIMCLLFCVFRMDNGTGQTKP